MIETPYLVLTGLVLGLTQIIKDMGMSSRFAPAVAIGIALGLGYGLGMTWVESLVCGLSAMGVYAGSKKTVVG